MKRYSFLFIALFCLMISCGKKEPASLEDLKGHSAVDSMMYYFGEMQAAAYWQDAETDTVLRTEQARHEFLEGVKAAMEMDKESEAYNKGLQLGLRLALRIREFQDRYDMSFSEKIFQASLKNSLMDDNRDSIALAQKGFYKLKDRLELEAANKELADSKKELKKLAPTKGFTMLSDTLYAKEITPAGPGPRIKEGDRVAVSVSASTLDGQEIVARQFPDSITLGSGRVPKVVAVGIQTMTDGQTKSFMTTPRTLFGKRYKAYHLPYDEPVIFTVKATQN